MKILFLGNSYSEDTGTYFPQLAKDFSIDLDIEMLVYPGCSIDQHIDFLSNAKPVYIHHTFNKRKNGWEAINEQNGIDVIKGQFWDYIIIQQCSAASGMNGTYDKLDDLINLVLSLSISQSTKFLWNMTWAWPTFNNFAHKKEYYNNSSKFMLDGIIKNVNDYIKTNNHIYKIIPTCLGIEHAKVEFAENLLFRDEVHLSYDLGRYIASLTAFKKIFDVDVLKTSFYPTQLSKLDKEICKKIANIDFEI